MKKLLLLFFIGISFSFTVDAQLSKKMAKDTVVWTKGVPLTTDIFLAKRAKGTGGYTSSGIIFYVNEKNGNMIFNVQAYFLKSKSFLKDSSIYALHHEQLHFDIAELYARKIRQKIIARDFKKIKNIQQEIQRYFDKSVAEWNREEEKYDNDTEHGMNAVKQKVWSEDIAKQLEELSQFESTEIDVVNK